MKSKTKNCNNTTDRQPFGLTLFDSVFGYSSKGAKVDLDLGNGVIRMINTSSKALEAVMNTFKYMQKSKTQDGTKPDTKNEKIQIEKGLHGASDPRAVGPQRA